MNADGSITISATMSVNPYTIDNIPQSDMSVDEIQREKRLYEDSVEDMLSQPEMKKQRIEEQESTSQKRPYEGSDEDMLAQPEFKKQRVEEQESMTQKRPLDDTSDTFQEKRPCYE
jgi:hypothetical protein